MEYISELTKLKELTDLEEYQQKTLNSKKEEIIFYKEVLKHINSLKYDDKYFFKNNTENGLYYCIREYNPIYTLEENTLFYGVKDLNRLKEYVLSKINFDYKQLNKTLEEIKVLEENINLKLKYFNQKMSNKTKGMVLKLLDKEYNNPFKENGLNGYTKKLYELINFAIENNIRFYLQYKTLENECLKVFDSDLNKWV